MSAIASPPLPIKPASASNVESNGTHQASGPIASRPDNLLATDAQETRLKCVRLLLDLPETGLDEALESLISMRDFYSNPSPRYVPPEPGPGIPAIVGKTILAPVFPISEDDL